MHETHRTDSGDASGGGVVNPEDQRARAQCKPQPRSGTAGCANGSTRYSVREREDEIAAFLNGDPIKASVASIYRWMDELYPRRMTGNKQKEKLVGSGQMLLVMYMPLSSFGISLVRSLTGRLSRRGSASFA